MAVPYLRIGSSDALLTVRDRATPLDEEFSPQIYRNESIDLLGREERSFAVASMRAWPIVPGQWQC